MRGRPATIRDEDILDAARDVFLERGLDATVADVAERAGTSEATVFNRYKTKEALFIAVIDRAMVMPPILDELPARVGKDDIASNMYAVAAEIVRSVEGLLPLMMMAWSSTSRSAVFAERFKHPNPHHMKVIRALSGYFEAEVRANRLRPVDPEILARAFAGGVSEYVMSQIMHCTADALPIASTTYLRGLVNLLLEGALPTGGRR